MPVPQCLKIHYLHRSNLTMKPVSQQCKSFFSSGHHRTLQLLFFFPSFSFALLINLPTSEEGTCVVPEVTYYTTHLLVQLQTRQAVLPSVCTLEPLSSCNWTRLIPTCAVRLVRHCICLITLKQYRNKSRCLEKRFGLYGTGQIPGPHFVLGFPHPASVPGMMFSRKKGSLGTPSLSFTKTSVDKIR